MELHLSILGGGSCGGAEGAGGAGKLAHCVRAPCTWTLRNADGEQDAPPSSSPL